ncbi:MAG: NRDE family protein [Gammaproteobacteria bacterium]|nr:NRDE family protein [Pseudomonadales bacterium]MCP5347547.1 NRDE family protein [Pseudomonadales bacterium]
MCLIIIAFRSSPRLPLVVAANRDEVHSRPTRPARFWASEPPRPGLLAGQDLTQGGTWLGITRTGRFAAVTNFRSPGAGSGVRSRGFLIRDFLLGEVPASDYLNSVRENLDEYGGFNLLVGDTRELLYLNGVDAEIQVLQPGFYGLSNAALDSDWPKVQRGRQALQELLAGTTKTDQGHAGAGLTTDALTRLMLNRNPAPDHLLPQTGIPLTLERSLSSSFIVNPQRDYGTRCTTALIIDNSGSVRFSEQSYGADAEITTRRYFHFPLLREHNEAA